LKKAEQLFALLNDPVIKLDLLPYSSALEPRKVEDINLVVIHCTELPDLATAREYGERILYTKTGTGNSGHYYIERSGMIHQWIPIDRISHHVAGFNSRSIGIEMVNKGRYPDWYDSRNQEMEEPYSAESISALQFLLIDLKDKLPQLEWIAAHQSLDTNMVPSSNDPGVKVYRKRDPGPLFPWHELLAVLDLKMFEP
jgi:N-acetylmuramoyl-L-alanine amidase